MGHEPEVEPERSQQGRRPRAGDEDDHRRLDAPSRGLDTDDTSALGQDPQDFASRLDGGAETPRGLGEGERRRVRIRESRLGLPGGGADVVGPATGQ